MLKHSYVPAEFGKGIIVPLVKDHSGDVCNVDNYRGITISSVVSKIFENCLLFKCERYLFSDKLQPGFKKGVVLLFIVFKKLLIIFVVGTVECS